MGHGFFACVGILACGVPALSLAPRIRYINKQEMFVHQNLTASTRVWTSAAEPLKAQFQELVLGAPLWWSEALLYLTNEARLQPPWTSGSCSGHWAHVDICGEAGRLPRNGQPRRLPDRDSSMWALVRHLHSSPMALCDY